MKKTFSLLLNGLLLAAVTASGALKPEYKKLFKKPEQLTTCHTRDLTLYLYEEKLYMELPVRNLGREFLVSSVVTSSTSMQLNGANAGPSSCFVIDRVDTLVTFRKPQGNYVLDATDNGLQEAFRQSRAEAFLSVYPIKAWSKDSANIVFDATAFFRATNKSIFDLKGQPYGDGTTISAVSAKSEGETIDAVEAFDRCVSISRTFTADVTMTFMIVQKTETCQFSLQTVVALLPENYEMMRPREASGSVGTGYVVYDDFRTPENTRKGYYATRRNYQPGGEIILYVDTLLSDSWRAAVQRAADGWNDAFEHQDLGRPFVLRSYPKDSTFSSSNPLLNIVSLANSTESSFTVRNVTDPRTGEILSTRIRVPRNLAHGVRRTGIVKMAETDSRYRTYYLPDDLLCDILQARMLTALGRSLGLATNLAGSAAYSPAQLRSPEFTQQYGFTASVMDAMIYNYVAMPGDKERGVVLTFQKPGVCDEFVLKYLYTPIAQKDEARVLKHWIREHAGDPRYKYGRRTPLYAPDPTAQQVDMGNDPIAASQAWLQHLKYVAKHGREWFDIDHLPTDFVNLFPEFIAVDLIDMIGKYLRYYVGGVYHNEWVEGSSVPLEVSVPRQLQHDVVMEMLEQYDDLSWVDAEPAFTEMHGVTNSVDNWGLAGGLLLPQIIGRLSRMDYSIDRSSNPYTHRDFLNDMESYAFKSVKAGRRVTDKDVLKMEQFVSALIQVTPELKDISSRKQGAASALALTDDPSDLSATLPDAGVEPNMSLTYYHATDLAPIVLAKLKELRPQLVRAKGLAPDDFCRSKLDYVLLRIDRVLAD